MPSDAVAKMISVAEATLGWSDEDNTVRTPVHTWYNNKFGNPDSGKYAWDWCDGWVTYVAWQAGQQAAVVFNTGYAYTVAHADDFRAKGQWHTDVAGIQAGDIVFFDWDGSNDIDEIDHVGLVVGVDGANVLTIEGNIENAVRRKTRTAATIVGYGRPKYTGGTTTPPPSGGGTVSTYTVKAGDTLGKIATAQKVAGGWEALYAANKAVIGKDPDALEVGMKLTLPGAVVTPPKPPVPPTPPPTAKSVVFEDCGPNGLAAANKVVQAALNKFKAPVTVDGIWGPKTSAAYAGWQRHLGFTGSDADGKPGITSLTRLGAAYGFNVTRRAPGTPTPKPPATGGAAAYLTASEPAADYRRVVYGGRTVNVRTKVLLERAAAWSSVTIRLTQGSYNSSVSASAGTHDGGGAVDINVGNWSASLRATVVQNLRKAGFAAWLRTPSDGFAYHIHAIAIGDSQASSGAKSQVQSYFNGRNGLANNRADSVAQHWPNWADKYNR